MLCTGLGKCFCSVFLGPKNLALTTIILSFSLEIGIFPFLEVDIFLLIDSQLSKPVVQGQPLGIVIK